MKRWIDVHHPSWLWLWYLPWHWLGHFGMKHDYRAGRPRMSCQWCARRQLREWLGSEPSDGVVPSSRYLIDRDALTIGGLEALANEWGMRLITKEAYEDLRRAPALPVDVERLDTAIWNTISTKPFYEHDFGECEDCDTHRAIVNADVKEIAAEYARLSRATVDGTTRKRSEA